MGTDFDCGVSILAESRTVDGQVLRSLAVDGGGQCFVAMAM
jgi:hypothetical protein